MPACQTPEQERNESERLRLFGVSGHRDLVATDLPELRRLLELVFTSFARGLSRQEL